jgi:hypothetical protein
MEEYYEEYHEPNYKTVYEIVDSISDEFVTNTEDRDVAEQYDAKGYFVNEHRYQKMMPSKNVEVTTIATIYW